MTALICSAPVASRIHLLLLELDRRLQVGMRLLRVLSEVDQVMCCGLMLWQVLR